MEADAEGDSGIDFPDGCREPNLAVTCKAVGLIVCTRRIDQTVRPIARCLRGWSGEATDRSRPRTMYPHSHWRGLSFILFISASSFASVSNIQPKGGGSPKIIAAMFR